MTGLSHSGPCEGCLGYQECRLREILEEIFETGLAGLREEKTVLCLQIEESVKSEIKKINISHIMHTFTMKIVNTTLVAILIK